MSLSEFELIERYFSALGVDDASVVLGVGDDAAVLQVPRNQHLLISVDTSIANVHFPDDADPHALGHRALAVNLSDMAAMAAMPKWFTLSLSLPNTDESWLSGFSKGMARLAETFDISLVGGDTTRGELAISIQIMGLADPGKELRRSGALAGDRIYVSGTLGDAAAGLYLYRQETSATKDKQPAQQFLLARYLTPQPQVVLGQVLADYASSCIDLSDGLLADLGHILHQSNCGARVVIENIPLSAELQSMAQAWPEVSILDWALCGGDDYQLCFTVAPSREQAMLQALELIQVSVSCIGEIVPGSELQCEHHDGKPYQIVSKGYQHFNRE